MKHRLHIAMIAIACNPYQVSEGGLGWKSICALAPLHKLTVFTHSNNRDDVERYLISAECPDEIKAIDFIFVARAHGYHPNQALARMLNWYYYHQWIKECINDIRERAKVSAFDLAHHITYSTWRMGSPFHKSGLPTVWGPVGGAGSVPFSAFSILSREAKITEGIRGVLSHIFRFFPVFKESLDRNTVVLASNQETKGFLQPFSKKEIGIVFPTYFEANEASLSPQREGSSGLPTLKCFYGGGIIGSKGISMSLAAIAKACAHGADISFSLAGEGPEKEHLQELAKSLGIAERVKFLPMLTGGDYTNMLNESHVFLFPSFRENIGITMVDAMLHETAPIVLDTSAPGEIVTSECGWKIPVGTIPEIIDGISSALLEASRNTVIRSKKASAARERILGCYSKDQYLSHLGNAYLVALDSKVS